MHTLLHPPVVAVLFACLAAAFAASPAHAQRKVAATCVPRDPVAVTVAAAKDGQTLLLGDGREVRLAAIELPRPAGKTGGDPSPLGEAARAALAAMVAGQDVALSALPGGDDRYGRLRAMTFTGNPDRTWVEAALVAQGLAYAAPQGEKPCLDTLLAAESAARTAKIGLWGVQDYDTMAAENVDAVLGARGRFALVEGKVVSVRESGGTIYVNFGRRWSEDFTVTILKRSARLFTAAGTEPKTLAGRRVRVRGWVEERGGPWIEAVSPSQIEIVAGR